MAGHAIPFAFKDGFAARCVTSERCDQRSVRRSSTEHGAHVRNDGVGLRFGKWIRRHSRVRHPVTDNANHVVIRASCLECALREINPDDLVAILTVTTSAIGFIQLRARVDFSLRIAVLLGENRRSKGHNCAQYQDKDPSCHCPPPFDSNLSETPKSER